MNLIELKKVSLNIDQERIINNISLKLNKILNELEEFLKKRIELFPFKEFLE